MKTLLALLSLVCVCGCSANNSLAHKLKEADRVVATDPRDNLSITVTGEQVTKIVQAIAAGKKESPLIMATPGLRLEFFKGGKHLGTVDTSYLVFWIEDKPYRDTTQALKELYQNFHDEHLPQFSP